MTKSCPHLEYRRGDDDDPDRFDHDRPYCDVVEAFVQPMRADVCNARHDLSPESDCEFYRDAHDLGAVTGYDPSD